MKQKKDLLRDKFIEFQTRIAELNLSLNEQEHEFRQREQKMLIGLLEIVDDFENLENHILAKEETFDKTTGRLTKSMRSIQKKMLRFLKSQNIVKIEFSDSKATIESCKIIDTKEATHLENETIISIIKNGYRDKKLNRVIRKAEVITVLNDRATISSGER